MSSFASTDVCLCFRCPADEIWWCSAFYLSIDDGAAIQHVLASNYGIATVPAFFVDSTLIGGYTDAMDLHKAGQLTPVLKAVQGKMKPSS